MYLKSWRVVWAYAQLNFGHRCKQIHFCLCLGSPFCRPAPPSPQGTRWLPAAPGAEVLWMWPPWRVSYQLYLVGKNTTGLYMLTDSIGTFTTGLICYLWSFPFKKKKNLCLPLAVTLCYVFICWKLKFNLCFPGGSNGKESAWGAGDLNSISGLGRSPGGGNGNPL